MPSGRPWRPGVREELAFSLVAGLVAGAFLLRSVATRIDDAIVVFLAIVVAAAIPGVTLTAAAARPPAYRLAEARRLGHQLQDQVRFWFGYMLWGSLAVFAIIVGKALEWESPLNRPPALPRWVPVDGSSWLIFASTFLTVFTIVRIPRIGRAVLDLIELGTQAHLAEARDNISELRAELAAELTNAPSPRARGGVEHRSAEPRRAG